MLYQFLKLSKGGCAFLLEFLQETSIYECILANVRSLKSVYVLQTLYESFLREQNNGILLHDCLQALLQCDFSDCCYLDLLVKLSQQIFKREEYVNAGLDGLFNKQNALIQGYFEMNG